MILQFASNGIWEEALRLETPIATISLKDWLKTAADDIAVELFFGEAAFIGVRLKPFQHESELMRLCANPSITSLREIFGTELFCGEPTFAELGVVNAWQSLGTKIIWRQGENVPNRNNLEIWIRPKPIAIEFAYSQPLPHWRAYPVSVQSDAGYQLDLDLLHAALIHQINAE